ncbi:hypothetical protein Vafri_20105 [Volvox africanus]|uniref:Ankyrin repeat protein n=1 Tax=Volvox africanus TaxID=51714 RepID=A0A8J4BQR0_9CHLO|nr:hypothetical protein Vafri_20105 [Volvox africanus]
MRRATTSPAGSAWLTAKDAVVLLSTGTPSKLGQELSRGVDPNQALEIPCMDEEILPRAALQTRWPETPEHQRRSFLKFREELLPPEGPLYAACAAELEANWAWDKSWDEHVPRPSASASVGGGGGGSGSGESSPSSSSSRNQAPSSSELDQASDARWPLLLVACMLGHTPLLLEKLLKAGADPNVTHKRSGVTALMCLTTNQRMGASAKKEGIQMLAKHGFNRWGAVRRDSCLDAILNLLIVVANTQHITRRLMSTRQLNGGPSAVSAKGGGGTGTTGAGASSLAAALKTCHKTVQDSMEVLQELLRRRCWPPARGCPPYVSSHLLEQLAVAIVMLDATSSRVLELLTGPYARNTGFGRSTASLHLLVMKLCECTGCTFMDSVSRVQLMSLPGLLRRLVAAGVRLEEPVVTETGVVNLLEPRLMDDTKLMTAALEAGMPLGLMPTRTAGPMCSPPWRSMLAEFITEHHKRGMVEVLLRHGADPRAPVLGCIRPLALAFMSANPSAFMALRGAGAPRSDAPPSLDEILDEICLEDIQRSLVQLARMPLRTTTQPLLWRHISWLMTLSVRELLHLIPVLSSPNTSNALTLLALLRCVNSRLVSGPLQGIDFASKVEVEKEGSVVTGGGGTLGSGTTPKWAGQSSWAAVELGEHSSLIADFVQENPSRSSRGPGGGGGPISRRR